MAQRALDVDATQSLRVVDQRPMPGRQAPAFSGALINAAEGDAMPWCLRKASRSNAALPAAIGVAMLVPVLKA